MKKESNSRDPAAHVPSCATWPPVWLSAPPPSAPCEPESRQEAPPLEQSEQPERDVGNVPSPAATRPQPPPGARLYFGDIHGRPCTAADKADHWCWEGGPTWYKVAEHPVPTGVLAPQRE
jgi:hypothetical protein